MGNDQFDVAIVGGGPGGATAAAFLGRAGIRTLLVDKARFPRDKSCGDAVCGRSVELLRELGLEPPPLANGFAQVVGQIFYNLRGDGLELPFVVPQSRNGHSTRRAGGGNGATAPAYVIPREIFDDMLVQHARRQPLVTVAEGLTFSDLIRTDGRVDGIVATDEQRREHRFAANLVIGADGALSRVAQVVGSYDFRQRRHEHWIGAFRIYYKDIAGLGDRIEIHFLDELMPGYLWIFPTGDGMANVGAGMVESFLVGQDGAAKMNLKKVTYELIASHPRLRPRFAAAKETPRSFRGWQLPCGSERRRIAGDGWMLIGDAAQLIDPFSGEGIANAMLSGKLAAEHAVEALHSGTVHSGGLASYESAVWDELGEELDTAYRLQRLLLNRGARWLLDTLVHRAAKRPRVREALVDMMVHGELGQLTNPLVCAKLLVEWPFGPVRTRAERRPIDVPAGMRSRP